MTVACYVDTLRPKTFELITAFAQGCDGTLVHRATPDPKATDHALVAKGVAHKLVPEFQRDGANFWYLDSAYIQLPGRTESRIERSRGWPPEQLGEYSIDRAWAMGVRLQPWRRFGAHVLLCLPGPAAGTAWGIDMRAWWADIQARLREVTDRPILVRPRWVRKTVPLETHLEDAWCVVTHSSSAAVMAAISGVPVFCEPTCAAAPVGRTDLDIENPVYPDREGWIAALAWRQFSREELRSGMAWAHITSGA